MDMMKHLEKNKRKIFLETQNTVGHMEVKITETKAMELSKHIKLTQKNQLLQQVRIQTMDLCLEPLKAS